MCRLSQKRNFKKKRKCDDFESIKPTSNRHDHQIEVKIITSQGLLFVNKLHFSDLIMADFQLPRWILEILQI